MSPVHVLDNYYLAITLLVTVGYQLSGFVIAWTFQFDKITDFTGGSNFFILALLTLLLENTFYARNIVASVLVMLWASRLSGFLLFRVLKMGSDTRFDDIRSHFLKFLGFWVGQIVWVWTVSLPLIILNSPAVSDPALGGSNPAFGTSRDIAGIVLWALGWVIETVADAQKFYGKNKGWPKDRAFTLGLWRWSRHPPYFGEMMCWWGIWILCLSPTTNGSLPASARAAQYGSVVSPAFTFILLMFASGVPTAEKPQARRFYLMSYGPRASSPHAWEHYKNYLKKTSILVPFPPTMYRILPRLMKQALFLDLPMFEFKEGADGLAAVEEERSKMAQV
ncbi:DUF1295-domain-containing protein [Punctularia strigosozonata HHB-11173 SS5]|uniref:DUF1295-domain-containing protein n=1 Tax=Punctularia strigosozonata (strain HHB-11173) TaxID=741275 RepID=UPI000441678C|nr:DUF1295-domain-containing protein [Punctularia strigosozonata HHB-11173 SS5]EIN06027.1 DUF1295-domain-containing protein [Punctularia strigosozonata HHB-11173 SS5]